MYVFMTGIFENGVKEKFVPLHRLTPSDKPKVNNIKTEDKLPQLEDKRLTFL